MKFCPVCSGRLIEGICLECRLLVSATLTYLTDRDWEIQLRHNPAFKSRVLTTEQTEALKTNDLFVKAVEATTAEQTSAAMKAEDIGRCLGRGILVAGPQKPCFVPEDEAPPS